MVYTSSYSSPDITPPDPEILETSSPWSDVLLEELQQAMISQQSPERNGKYGYLSPKACRTNMRNMSRFLWLSIFVIVGFCWALRGGRGPIRFRKSDKQFAILPDTSGLQFIEASHPCIRVRKALGQTGFTDLMNVVCWTMDRDI